MRCDSLEKDVDSTANTAAAAEYCRRPNKKEPIQYVQWNQGEDRWLCTLLLQKGWRIEYVALSDAYTNAPTDLGEFFNQRRRWGPSTVFNIWDLVKDLKEVSFKNDYISKGYRTL